MAITLRDVCVERGGRRVVDGVTTSVAGGRITGLIGPSGCGKSTLMRAKYRRFSPAVRSA